MWLKKFNPVGLKPPSSWSRWRWKQHFQGTLLNWLSADGCYLHRKRPCSMVESFHMFSDRQRCPSLPTRWKDQHQPCFRRSLLPRAWDRLLRVGWSSRTDRLAQETLGALACRPCAVWCMLFTVTLFNFMNTLYETPDVNHFISWFQLNTNKVTN